MGIYDLKAGLQRSYLRGSLARVDSDRGIPDFVESEALKVFDICGSEFLHPKSLQAQGCSHVIDASAGKVRSGGLFPDLCVDVSASRWEPDDLPPWMKSVGLDDFNRFAWIQRFLKNGWISEEKIKLTQHELAQSHVFSIG